MWHDSSDGAPHDPGTDTDIRDFGDVVGLKRLYKAVVERIRQMDIPEADKRAWIEELTRQYWAATAEARAMPPTASDRQSGRSGQGLAARCDTRDRTAPAVGATRGA
jgi:hypothetical protein